MMLVTVMALSLSSPSVDDVDKLLLLSALAYQSKSAAYVDIKWVREVRVTVMPRRGSHRFIGNLITVDDVPCVLKSRLAHDMMHHLAFRS